MLADCVYDDQELLKEDVLISVISTKPPENTKDSSQLGEKMFDFGMSTTNKMQSTTKKNVSTRKSYSIVSSMKKSQSLRKEF